MKTIRHNYNGKASPNSFFPYFYYKENKSISLNNKSEDTQKEIEIEKSVDELEDIVSSICTEAIITTPVIEDLISKIDEDVVETPITSPETLKENINISSGSLDDVPPCEEKNSQKKIVKTNITTKKTEASKPKSKTCMAHKCKPKHKTPKYYNFI